ncbi:minichromosome maintenance (MCM2/3/5) family protein [Trifolium repens]|nr:minichromosome maintenance (MCM2/3/5) family protein [Trifolium repens]
MEFVPMQVYGIDHIGDLKAEGFVSVTGVVTRTSEVRPELLKGTFKCMECGGIIKNVEQQFKLCHCSQQYVYMQPVTIERTKWALLGKESKFTYWQKVRRMQETSKEIPAGCLLRSLDVILRHEIVEHARAGKLRNARVPHLETKVTGLKALGVRDVSYHLTFIANSVQICDGRKETDIRNRKKDSDEYDQQFTAQEQDEVQRMRNTQDFYILQALFQDLCIYTSGKSSAAGLTAIVAKEPETGEFCIEADALMLADNCICRIDEFDKMKIRDQAMEQHTISITKAGIQSTLNARISILAAANPAGGQYDKCKSLKYNVAVPPSILQAEVKRYVAYAKTLKPMLTSDARKRLLEALIRLSEATTRIYLENQVQPHHVDEAEKNA